MIPYIIWWYYEFGVPFNIWHSQMVAEIKNGNEYVLVLKIVEGLN